MRLRRIKKKLETGNLKLEPIGRGNCLAKQLGRWALETMENLQKVTKEMKGMVKGVIFWALCCLMG